MKKCNKCGKIKPLSEFYKNKENPDGHHYSCKICFNKYMKEYYRRPDRARENRRRSREYHRKLRTKILNRFNNKCNRCGFDDWRSLQIDHIKGGGTKETKLFGGVKNYYKHLLSLSNDELFLKYQCLCANCNQIKKYENNETATANRRF